MLADRIIWGKPERGGLQVLGGDIDGAEANVFAGGEFNFLERDGLPGDVGILKHHVAFQTIVIAHYNFVRKHETLRGATPAMASKLTDHMWTIRELLEQSAFA